MGDWPRSLSRYVFTVTELGFLIPSTAIAADVWLIAGGGGGGSGAKRNAGASGGGSPGTGGGASHGLIFADSLPASSLDITVGVGGQGGAAQATNGADGNDGQDGTDSSFGGLISAGKGYGGKKGTTVGGLAPAFYGVGGLGIGATGVAGGLLGAGPNGEVSLHNSAGSGGGGAGVSAAVAFQAGGNAGVLANRWVTAVPAGGTNAPTPGANAVPVAGSSPVPGHGGGGGGTLTAGGNGVLGGGGGGGGAGVSTIANSGGGGNGGAGIVVVFFWF